MMPLQYYGDFVAFELCMEKHIREKEFSSFHKAFTYDEVSQWIGAIKEKLESFHKNQTQELVEKPIDQKIMSCKLIFKKKGIIRFKVSLVAKGFTQQKDIDFNEAFFPIVKHSFISVLLALVST